MQAGRFLIDVTRQEQRFRVHSLLFEGHSYQIALAEDTHMDDKLVCVKTVAYDESKISDKTYVAQRRKALHQEMQFLASGSHLLPEPLDWIQLEESETVLPREPVLVYEYVHGETLYEHITQKSPQGMAPLRALRIVKELADFLAEIHNNKWVFRSLDPRHIIISVDDIIHVVGCGNATRMMEKPLTMQAESFRAYVAPEIRDELSGQFLRAPADLYSLAALFSFMVTGEEPAARVENPLTRTAYERLTALEPQGIALLIAKNLQPMAKNRLVRADRFASFCETGALPSPTTKDFGMMALPAPWSGAEAPDSRAARSKISAGPLISVPREPAPVVVTPQPEHAVEKAKPQGCRQMLVRLGLTSAVVLWGVVGAVALL